VLATNRKHTGCPVKPLLFFYVRREEGSKIPVPVEKQRWQRNRQFLFTKK
jgi:hypothetical protein